MKLRKRNNKWYKFSLLLLIFICFIALSASAQNSTEAKAESLYKQHKASKALDLYNRVVKRNKHDVSALWHSSLLYSRLGSRFTDKNKQKKYFTIAKNRAITALKQKPQNSMANYAMAVAIGRIAAVSDLQQKMMASGKIRKYAVRAIKANSANDGAWNILSRWNYGFANMDQNKRAAAKIFLGDMVKGTSYKKALKYGKKAVKYNPSVVAYYLSVAKAYKGLGDGKKAVETCQKALKKSPLWLEGKAAQKGCQDLIANLSVK